MFSNQIFILMRSYTLVIGDRNSWQQYMRFNAWVGTWDVQWERNIWRERCEFTPLQGSLMGVGRTTLSNSGVILFNPLSVWWESKNSEVLPQFPKKVTMRVSGIGWRYWLKHRRMSMKFRVNHSFKIRYFIPKGFQLTKINRYFFRFQFWSAGWLNQTIYQLIQIQPTYSYKDIGIRSKQQLPTLKKLQKKLY